MLLHAVLQDFANEMEVRGRHHLGVGKDGVMAFTDFGIENLISSIRFYKENPNCSGVEISKRFACGGRGMNNEKKLPSVTQKVFCNKIRQERSLLRDFVSWLVWRYHDIGAILFGWPIAAARSVVDLGAKTRERAYRQVL